MTTTQSAAQCPSCHQGMMAARPVTEKRRVKFGILWVLVSLFSLGLGLILWLIMPRKNVVTSWVNQCDACGYRLA